MKKEKNACDIIKHTFPEWFNSNMWDVVYVCLDNKEWCERLIDRNQLGALYLTDINHDVRGLRKEDEHFLPRI